MKIKISELEKKLNYKIKKDFTCIGLDTAKRTGVCFVKTDKTYVDFDWCFLEFNYNNQKEMLKQMHYEFKKLFSKEKLAIIEEVFLGINPSGSLHLAKMGTLAVAQCLNQNIDFELILAKSARAKFFKLNPKEWKGKSKQAVAQYLKSIDIVVDDNDISDCYDKETEVLTNEGWKYFKNLNGKEKCLSMSLDTKIANYNSIQKIIKQKYKGKMYSYKSATCNFLVTPNHKMIIRTTNVPKYIKECKKSILKRKKNGQFTKNSHIYWNNGKWKWHFEEIQNIKATYWWMPRTCIWNGIEQKKYIIPELKREKMQTTWKKTFFIKHWNWKKKQINMNDWLEFLGWYISEGNLQYNRTKNCVNSVCITQTKDKKKINEIKSLLKRLQFKYNYLKQKIFQINNAQLATHLSKICYDKNIYNCYNKKVPTFIKNLSKEQIDIFLNAFNKGDGWIEKAGNRNYRTHSKQLANDIQELIIKLGKCCSLRTEKPNNIKRWYKNHYIQTKTTGYHIKEFKYTDVYIQKKDIKLIDYDNYIYCVQCEPNNTLLIRRNGQVFWSGNSIILALCGICEGINYGKNKK